MYVHSTKPLLGKTSQLIGFLFLGGGEDKLIEWFVIFV